MRGVTMDIFLIKMNGALHPASEHDREQLKKIKSGRPVRVTLRRVRNYEFHKKFFALMNLAFENWEVPLTAELTAAGYKNLREAPIKDFDRFRKDVTILAGYYDATYRVDGSVRLEAKSISFANMDQDEFDKLYEATIEVIRKHVFKNMTGAELDLFLNELEEFT